MRFIKRIAVLGSGVMGTGIAAHMANAGFEVLMLDLPSTEGPRNEIADRALMQASRQKPNPFFKKDFIKRITTGNFEDDLHSIQNADWIIEVIVEKLEIKKSLFEKVEKFRKPGSIVSSNTSGIPIHQLAEGRGEDFRKHFIGTHFFNPPRYLRLLEIIPTKETDPVLVSFMKDFARRILGKETIIAKDTPAFIANRIGVYAMAKIFQLTAESGLPVPSVDKLTGPGLGRPNTGTFRLADLVGHDTGIKVMKDIRANCPADEQAAAFEVPPYMQFLLDNNFLGNKTGQGFYKRSEIKSGSAKTEFLSLNLNTLTYEEDPKSKLPSLGFIKQIDDVDQRIKALYNGTDEGALLVRNHLCGLFSYASHRIPEISDSIAHIDTALKAGFAWPYGPFEYWDLIGVKKGMADAKSFGYTVSDWVETMLATGHETFYVRRDGKTFVYSPLNHTYEQADEHDEKINLNNLRDRSPVYKNEEAVLHDIGDGVLCFEFRSKSNVIGEGIMRGLNESIRIAEEDGWKGLVIGNHAANFTVGANLMLIGMMAFQEEWDELSDAVQYFQQLAMRCRYSAVPVVVATQGYVFGGGVEISMHCDGVVAAAESYFGLVEASVGIIPAGGGTKEFAVRLADTFDPGDVQIPSLIERCKVIGTATVATSAYDAFDLGYLQKEKDEIVMHSASNILEAKRKVLALSKNYVMPIQRSDILVLGQSGLAALYAFANEFKLGGYGSDHDIHIVRKIAWVLCGGDLTGPQHVTEQYLLDLEREAFLSLCGEKKTKERIQYMLENNKPLRN